ncbi:MAG TPA: radical SAM protein [Verrucomicrobiae bacterium]|nr:radical SAM protein [Verrucomicrobiae bacterium]
MIKHRIATLFVSTTDRCNLACRYCSAAAGPGRKAALAPEIAERAVRQWLSDLEGNRATLVMTGGEPILWGLENLERVCRVATTEAGRRSIDLTIGIQSNGVLVDDDFINLLQRWRIEPGFSLDGPPHVHDVRRGNGAATLAVLKRLQARAVRFAIVSCLTPELANEIEDALEWFRRQGFLKIRVNPIGEATRVRRLERLSPDTLFNVKKAIYEHMQRHQEGAVHERNVDRQVKEFDQAFRGRTVVKEHCEQLKCGAGLHLACLDPDGSFNLCVEKSMRGGLGRAASLDRLPRARQEFWRNKQRWSHCSSCPANAICDHGCAAYHQMDFCKFEHECAANRMFWKYLVAERAPSLTRTHG